eukprot:2509125-Prymnesium_polylepis.1
MTPGPPASIAPCAPRDHVASPSDAQTAPGARSSASPGADHLPLEHGAVLPARRDEPVVLVRERHVGHVRRVAAVRPVLRARHDARPSEQLDLAKIVGGGEQALRVRRRVGACAAVDVGAVR